MAMAEVFIPEPASEEPFTFPRAPPPSPEMQPRGLSSIFEIPDSKFEGALDLRRGDFDFSETRPTTGFSVNGYSSSKMLKYSERRTVLEEEDESDLDTFIPGSPKKRPCSSPSTLPNPLEINNFYRSGSIESRSSSLYVNAGSISSCEGLYSLDSRSQSTEHHQSHSNSNSPQHYTNYQSEHSCPIPQRPAGPLPNSSFSGSATPTYASQLSPEHTLANSHQQLSRSFDLHNVHSHLPLTFETTQLPEVRPARAHTLGASTYDDDASLRKRKISLKRRNEDIDSDPSLQFSFEYSYSSTGSSGDSDWVVVEHEASSYPQDKKKCCQDTPTSISSRSIFTTSLTTSAVDSPLFPRVDQQARRTNVVINETCHKSMQQPLSLAPDNGITQNTSYNFPLSRPPTLDSGFGSYMSSNLNHDTATCRLGDVGPQMSMESVTMMDCVDYGTRLDSLDSMDCGQSEQQQQSLTTPNTADMETPISTHPYSHHTSNFHTPTTISNLSTHQQQHFLFEPTHLNTVTTSTLGAGRSHSSEAGYTTTSGHSSTEQGATTRHSFMENYFTAYHEQQSEGFVFGSASGSSRFNFSKSL